ncbi:hypothetical protein HDU77_009171 [Chytriomyces hyalinus]|nr:hypothetical protein HDU77_009171 [Chytriomyces hyalinus]
MAQQHLTPATSIMLEQPLNGLPDAFLPLLANLLHVEDPSRYALFQSILDATPDTAATYSDSHFYLHVALPQPPEDATPQELLFLHDLATHNAATVPPPPPPRDTERKRKWMECHVQFLLDENDKQIDIHLEGILFATSFNKEKDTHNSNYIRTFANVVPIMATLVGPHAQFEKHAKAGTMKCIPRSLFLAAGMIVKLSVNLCPELGLYNNSQGIVRGILYTSSDGSGGISGYEPTQQPIVLIEFAEYHRPPINDAMERDKTHK